WRSVKTLFNLTVWNLLHSVGLARRPEPQLLSSKPETNLSGVDSPKCHSHCLSEPGGRAVRAASQCRTRRPSRHGPGRHRRESVGDRLGARGAAVQLTEP